MTAPPDAWAVRGGTLPLDRPLVMGILNLTPDSFSDGGELPDAGAALERALRMVDDGAGILDIGGESTRPGASAVPVPEELRRVLPVIETLASRIHVPLSIDTRKAEVARAALEAGAAVVNDVSALAFDPAMASVVAESGAGVVLMHSRGTPGEMQALARYESLEREIVEELEAALARAFAAGVPRQAIVLDPGIGFAKTPAQNLRVLGGIPSLLPLGFPILVGPSRKSFLGALLETPPERRDVGTAAACIMAYLGGARIFRVHDVAATSQALIVAHAIAEARDRTDGHAVPDITSKSGRGVRGTR